MIKRVFVDFCYFLNTSIACQSGTGLISKRRKLRATQHNTTLSKLTKHLRFVSCPRYQSKLSKFTQLCDSKGKVPQSKDASSPKNRLHPLWSTEVKYLWNGRHLNLHIQL